MEPRHIIGAGIAASAIVHLSFVVLLIFSTEVHPFGVVTTEPVAVDIVTADEAAEKAPEPLPTPKPRPADQLDFSLKVAPEDSAAQAAAPAAAPRQAATPPPPAPPQPKTPPQKQAALSQPKPASGAAPAVAPSPAQPVAQPQASSPAQSPPPSYTPAQPDLSIKYHVLLGLPQDSPGDGFDAPATEKADIGANPIAEFRHHLRTCASLPKSIAPSDRVAIKLRVMLTPDGRLAADPLLIEASASIKGPLLMQSAIGALQACQPYAMLPADKYDEWKVLDLSFTPQDFRDAS